MTLCAHYLRQSLQHTKRSRHTSKKHYNMDKTYPVSEWYGPLSTIDQALLESIIRSLHFKEHQTVNCHL